MNFYKYKKYKIKYRNLTAGSQSIINCKGYINKPCPTGCHQIRVKNKGYTYCRKNKSIFDENGNNLEKEDEDDGIITSPSIDSIISKYSNLTIRQNGNTLPIIDSDLLDYLLNYGFTLEKIEYLIEYYEDNLTRLMIQFTRKITWLIFLLNINLITNYPSFDSLDIVLDQKFYSESFQLNNFIQDSKVLASGTEGSVYKLKIGETGNWEYTVKITNERIDLTDKYVLIETLEMMALYNMLSRHKIGPQIIPDKSFYLNIRDGTYKFITKKYRGSLGDFFESNSVTKELESKITSLLDKMLKMGIICVDQKPANLLVDWDDEGNIGDIVLTDFGRDWCCQSNIKDNCEYLTNKFKDKKVTRDYTTDFLLHGHNLLFMKLIMLFSISVMSLRYYDKLIFVSQLQILLNYLDTDTFRDFFTIVCENKLKECKSIYPPFYYLMDGEDSEEELIHHMKKFITRLKKNHSRKNNQ